MTPRRPLTIHLEHTVYCAAAGDCRCDRRKAGSSTFDPAKKKRVVSQNNVRLPAAVTLSAAGTPGDTIELHPAVLQTADAKRLLAARAIRVKPVASPPAEKAPGESALPAKQADTARRASKPGGPASTPAVNG